MVDPQIPGVWVYFKVFDVDDPFDQNHSNMPGVESIDDDTEGGDNRGSDLAVGNDHAITNEYGQASVTLTLSMQPGNNYRAAASNSRPLPLGGTATGSESEMETLPSAGSRPPITWDGTTPAAGLRKIARLR